jgi:hypothetical protein
MCSLSVCVCVCVLSDTAPLACVGRYLISMTRMCWQIFDVDGGESIYIHIGLFCSLIGLFCVRQIFDVDGGESIQDDTAIKGAR